ncbi:MAG TPA: xanthine dehydrogenase family protein molybdopterin-binding subunit [Thermohalobaculum sp.]|nr:xanthine dehydrogenase family protein molybdopterin-binding subunit [Thermohalobaculum sp.]
MKFGIGQSAPRLEDVRLLRGAGRFVDDIVLDGQAHAAVFRSPVAHGRIVRLDVAGARRMPGVLAVWTHDDIAGRLAPLGNDSPLEPRPAPVAMPHLADGRVRFAGQPVAFVVAETRHRALDAAEAIDCEIEDLDVVTDPEAALADGAPALHAEAPGNLAYRWETGDRDATGRAFAEAARVVSTPVLNQRLAIVPMEPRAILVRHAPDDGRWEVWIGSQGAHRMRSVIARALMVDEARVRVHVPDVGGGFGMKLMAHPEYGLAALAARDLGRPVKWVGDRSESFLSDAQGRDMRGTVEGAFDADGRCLAMRMRTVSGLGAYYSSFGAAIHTVFSAPLLGGMYAIGAHHAEVRGAFTNTTPMDAYRGAGRPETIYATERVMEQAARELRLDPAEIRRRNLIPAGRIPHTSPGGFTFDSLEAHRVLDRAVEAADAAGFPARAGEAQAQGARRGLGIAYYFERTGGAPFENTHFALGADGVLRVAIGTQSTGQGHETAWAQVIADRLGLAPDAIEVLPGDSDALAAGGGTGGSRSLVMASRVILRAADALIEAGREKAAEHLEAAAADIAFDAADGAFRIVGTDRAVTLAALAEAAGGLEADGGVRDAVSTFPNGCHVAEVEIDAATGRASLVRYTVVDDFGTLVNPALVAGQVHGGVVQGIGQVLGEAAVWDGQTGQPLSASFMDYAMPLAEDLPMIDVAFEEVPATTNPLGVKGCGEAGCCGAISATALAVLDALHRAGAAPVETPMTSEKLWRALNAA